MGENRPHPTLSQRERGFVGWREDWERLLALAAKLTFALTLALSQRERGFVG